MDCLEGQKIKMAESESEQISKPDLKTVKLTEEDIPGAKLPRDSIDKCSAVQLKRWLLCRGAKTTEVKKSLVARVQDYIKHGFDVKYLRDPDGSVNLLRKKDELGILDNEEPEITESFPKQGFVSDLKRIPRITFGTVWKFMIERVECKKQLSTAKPLVKGFNFYKSGHVLYVGHLLENGKHFIKSQVMPSMKKNKAYTCFLVISSFGKIIRAHCRGRCPAGIDGRFNHVASTLFALEQYCKERETLKQTPADTAESCTSKPCRWNVPRKRKGPTQPINQMNFVKHDYSKPSKVPKLNHSTTASAVPESIGDEKNAKILNMMKEYQSMSGNVVSWTHILPQEVPQEVNKPFVSPIKVHPVSVVELTEKMKKAIKNLTIDQSEVQKIESQTRGQSNTELWHQHRQPRNTATKCYRVVVQRDSTSTTKTIRDVLGYDKFCPSKAMQEGLRKEDAIIKDYKLLKQNQGGESITVTKCGFFESQTHGFLGASPDGIVDDPSTLDTERLIEIKYIQTLIEETLENALVRKGICKNDNDIVTLHERHKYYYQVQQQMFVTQRKWTDFVVKGTNSCSLFCQRVHFCKDHWESILPKLEAFFDNWIVPEIVYPRVKYGMCKLDARSL